MNEDSKPKSTSEDIANQGIPIRVSIPPLRHQRINSAINVYKAKAAEIIKDMESYHCPSFISDEYSIIVTETKELFSNDLVGIHGPFDNLCQYLNTQKIHLRSISMKQSDGDMFLEIISTQIGKAVLFHIEEALVVFDASALDSRLSHPLPPIDQVRKQQVMMKLWNAIKCLDTYKFTYAFKYKVYDKKREEIKKECSFNQVDVRSSHEKNKDMLTGITDDIVGCLVEIAILVGVFFLIYLIFGS